MFNYYRLGIVLLVFIQFSPLFAQREMPNKASYQLPIRKAFSPIQIDGRLDEADWKNATLADDFWEKDPKDGVRAVVRTTARVTYDESYLYVGIVCYDDDTAPIVQSLKRDNGFWGNDGVAIILDPFNEATNGFMFGVNAMGVQLDALLGGGSGDSNWNDNWDNIWKAETQQYSNYWTAELAIPFKSLRYEDGKMNWGLNFLRNDAKRNQTHVWTPIPRQFWGIDLGYAGQLLWDAPPPVAKSNVAIIPYVSYNWTRDSEAQPTSTQQQLAAGADAKVALGPGLNLDLTVNPDFSQVDVDVQQTNLTRFSLFFPERRQFFLENSNLFTDFGIPPVRPFFSRRIGLDQEGQAVPILLGARLTGNLNDNTRIGLMSVQTKANEVQLGQNYSTLAVAQRVLKRSTLRGMFINRQAYGEGGFLGQDYNRNADLEFSYQSVDGQLEAWSGYHHSFRPGIKQNNAFWNIGAGYTAGNVNGLIDFVSVGENYSVDVGFENRLENYDALRDTSIRRGYRILYTPINFTLLPKMDWLQNFNIELENALFFNDDFSLNERSSTIGLWASKPNTSSLSIGMGNYDIRLPFAFAFTDGEPLPAGAYTYTDFFARYASDRRKAISYSLRAESGGFYSGQRQRYFASLRYRKQPWGDFSLNAEYNKLRFPENFGEQEIWLVGTRLEANFSKNLFWTTFLQYNTQADNFNVNSRLQWQFRPLSWVFLVYSDNYAVNVWGPKNKSLVLKFSYWLVS